MYNVNMKQNIERKFQNLLIKNPVLLVIILGVIIVTGYWGSQTTKDNPTIGDKVSLIKCVDGDTARFNLNGVNEIVRFIGIDAPELDSNDYYAIEAKDFVCERLNNATSIELVNDPKSDQRDKFGRMIAWVYVDKEPLQFDIVEGGYAKVRYIYDDYMFVDKLNELQSNAKQAHKGIWR